ncbi:LLM class flavin-dependent oxidoreductase [Schaalia sp. 19OD2882]|uniref:LLM class flavin-dependent oxidoreductase n=1 Tax=Schaalia sp. 19OD2882 TaxID=2794089 RepID=UPI001C1F17CD|nr:LLM class flavin-dependent oxidoreductase [Schaalia sp. 19OD2882]QWW20215.1 LLM class flavin-dependent oxidoreductase [Schaalia sp. 19OD2882]
MKAFGFLSFGHYGHGRGPGDPDAGQALKDAVEIAVGADEIGVNGAYWRVHHFARQAASPFPLLATAAARTSRIEVGTGVIDMRYENPLYMAEEVAALDLLADQRIAIGISRGSPEQAKRGWEAFGYTGSKDPRGADIARAHAAKFLEAVRGVPQAELDPGNAMIPGELPRLRVEPHSPGVDRRLWWGAATRETAEWTARQGLNLMSSTLLTEVTGKSFSDLQAEQIQRYRAAWKEAGHDWSPRVSVSRSIFPIVSQADAQLFGLRAGDDQDHYGIIDGLHSTFGRTYAAEPDVLIEELSKDEAIKAADTLMLTIPSQLGVDYNVHVLQAFAEHVAPALGWKPNTEGPVTGHPVD